MTPQPQYGSTDEQNQHSHGSQPVDANATNAHREGLSPMNVVGGSNADAVRPENFKCTNEMQTRLPQGQPAPFQRNSSLGDNPYATDNNYQYPNHSCNSNDARYGTYSAPGRQNSQANTYSGSNDSAGAIPDTNLDAYGDEDRDGYVLLQ